MKNLDIPLRLVLLILLIIFSSCAKSALENTVEALTPDIETPEEDDGEGNEEEEGIPLSNLTAKVNDEDFDASKLITGPQIAAAVSFTNNGYFFIITAIDWQPSLKANQVILLSFFDFDFDDLDAGSKFDVPNPLAILSSEPGAYAAYAADLNTDDEIDGISTETIEEIYIEITAIDHENQLISGEFSFKGTAEDTTTTFEITEGVFTNVNYEIN